MALVEAGDDFFAQLDNPYPYVALIVGVCALALTNFAFWRSTANGNWKSTQVGHCPCAIRLRAPMWWMWRKR